jgi:hypothetical protein
MRNVIMLGEVAERHRAGPLGGRRFCFTSLIEPSRDLLAHRTQRRQPESSVADFALGFLQILTIRFVDSHGRCESPGPAYTSALCGDPNWRRDQSVVTEDKPRSKRLPRCSLIDQKFAVNRDLHGRDEVVRL